MIGLVGTAGRFAGIARWNGIWAVLLALVLGSAMALAVPPLPAPADGRDVLAASHAPWGNIRLPDPQAQTQRSLAAAVVSTWRWKTTSSPWPEPESLGIAGDSSRRPAARRTAIRRLRAARATPLERRLAYDPHGPPSLTP